MPFIIGIDLGGTAAKLGLCPWPLPSSSSSSTDDPLLHTVRVPLPTNRNERTPNAIVSLLTDACHVLLATGPGAPVNVRPREVISAIGLGFPGSVKAGGVAGGAANLCPTWKDVPLAKLLAEELFSAGGNGADENDGTHHTLAAAPPIILVNDADAALAAEVWQGAAKGLKNVVMLTLGTGIGMAAWVDGRPLTGSRGLVEGGHMIVEKEGRPCGCGQCGCLERYASATAVVQRAQELGFIAKKAAERGRVMTAKDVFDAAFRRQGGEEAPADPVAMQVVTEAAEYLGLGCLNIVRMLDPEMLLFGGGMSGGGDAFLGLVKQAFCKSGWTILPNDLRMEVVALGAERAGMLGAARAAAIALGGVAVG